MPPKFYRRLFMCLFGVITCGMSVALFKQSAFGTDPFQCFCGGMDIVIPISFGTLYMLINIALLVVVFFMNKRYIGIATFLNLFLVGYLVDFTESLLVRVCENPSLAVRIAYLAVGLVIMCFSSALYFTADLGVSTYDAIALRLSEKKPQAFRYIRIACDLACVGAGYLLGCVPGVGTILTAFCMGPLIAFFRVRFAEPFLHRTGPFARAQSTVKGDGHGIADGKH